MEISDQIPPPTADALYWRVWSDNPEGAAIFYQPTLDFPDGLMLLTLEVEPEGLTPFPPPDSTPTETRWGGRRVVQAYELTGAEAAPFALQLGFADVRSPYRYTLELNCLPAQGEDAMQNDARCRNAWYSITSDFGPCSRPFPALSEPEPWQSVSDAYYGYSFEVPGNWLVIPRATVGRLHFFSDQGVADTFVACPMPNGLMKTDFEAGTSQDFSPTQDGSGPVLDGYTATQVGDLPVWIRKTRGGEPAAPDMSPQLLSLSAYIEGSEYWYGLHLICYPPTGADEAGQVAYHAQCEETFNQILERFQVLPPQ